VGNGQWTHMCRFYFCELIWSVYLYLMCLCCENVKIKNFKFNPRTPPLAVTFQTQGLEVTLNIPAQNPKIGPNLDHFGKNLLIKN
jgi:hypothetical protein